MFEDQNCQRLLLKFNVYAVKLALAYIKKIVLRAKPPEGLILMKIFLNERSVSARFFTT